MINNHYLKEAYKEALKAYKKGEVPVGCVIVVDDKVIARGHNLRESRENPLAHAEIIALNKASKKTKYWRLEDASLYVTLEPCPMCAGAIIQARIKNVYFGALDKRNGSVISNVNLFDKYPHKVKFDYLETEECSKIITTFFQELREQKKNKLIKKEG